MRKNIFGTIVILVLFLCSTPTRAASFTIDLHLGIQHPEVMLLQQYLNAHGFTLASTGPGSPGNETDRFGAYTKAALIKFQEAHSDPILAGFKNKKGTGIFGPATRAFINKSEDVVTPAPSQEETKTTVSSATHDSVDTTTTITHHGSTKYYLTYLAGTGGTLTGTTSQSIRRSTDGQAVTAVADDHYHFTQWDDGITDNPRTDTTVMHSATITAQFAPDTYTVEYLDSPHGIVTGDTTQTIAYGSDATPVTAEPDTGYVFLQWSDGIFDNPRTDTNITGPISVSPIYDIDSGGSGGR